MITTRGLWPSPHGQRKERCGDRSEDRPVASAQPHGQRAARLRESPKRESLRRAPINATEVNQ